MTFARRCDNYLLFYFNPSLSILILKGSLQYRIYLTTLQSMMNSKLSQHRFWPCHENRLIKTIQTIAHNLYVCVKLTSPYCGLRLILVYPNPQ